MQPVGRTMTDTQSKDPRARGRELALVVLCHLEWQPVETNAAGLEVSADWLLAHAPRGDEPGEAAFAELAADAKARTFGGRLIEAARAHRETVDETIRAASQRWRLERMDQVDRNVLRLATTELLVFAKTPRAVVVSEAVRLAALYGSERSATFVNGVVETIASKVRPGRTDGTAGEGAS